MDVETLRAFCKTLPAVTEDIKWGNDLCFSVGEKMFCVIGLEPPHRFSFKVPDEDFEELSSREGFIPAPYMARAKWVMLQTANKLTRKQLEKYILESYTLVKNKLPKKLLKELGIH